MDAVWELLLLACVRKSHRKHEGLFLYKENFSDIMFHFQKEMEREELGIIEIYEG